MTVKKQFEYDPFKSDFQQQSHQIYRTLRDVHPVYHNEERGFWAISRFADVWAATLDLDALTTEGMEEAKALKPMLNFLDHRGTISFERSCHGPSLFGASRRWSQRSVALREN